MDGSSVSVKYNDQQDKAVLEFMAVVTRVRIGSQTLLSLAAATRETEELLDQFRILCPGAAVRLRLHHADTFDRQINAQALAEIPMITADVTFSLYKG